MKTLRVFISSVQKEFSKERIVLRDWLRNDPLMRRFFDCFLFEALPAIDRRSDEVYLDEVAGCDVYIGLIGNEYGFENESGLSPTESEFNEATKKHKTRLIFIKGEDDKNRDLKVKHFISRINNELIRRRYATDAELIAGVYAALIHYLETKNLIRSGPFDAAPCQNASFEDLDEEKMTNFIRHARHARSFPLAEKATPLELLTHLNLINGDQTAHAGILLFAKKPHRASTGQVTMEIERLVAVMHGEMSRVAIQEALDLRHRDYFNEACLIPALNSGYLEMTIPNKPTSSRQKYRLTEKGHLLQKQLKHDSVP